MKISYSLLLIFLFANTDISKDNLVIYTFILMKSNVDRREYQFSILFYIIYFELRPRGAALCIRPKIGQEMGQKFPCTLNTKQ
jgi:hypothetical protein